MTTARPVPEFGVWFTVADLADRTGLPDDFVNERIADGSLPSVLVWAARLVPELAVPGRLACDEGSCTPARKPGDGECTVASEMAK